MKRIAAALSLWTLLVGTTAVPVVWSQGYAEMQDEQARLDDQLIELQHEFFRARQGNDQPRIATLSKQIEAVQKRRLELLRALGQLR